jgi:hypothetical protein
MQKWVKNILIGGTAFVAYRLYKLWEMFNSVNWSFQRIQFTKPKLSNIFDSYMVKVTLKVHNPSSTTLYIDSLNGYLEYDGYVLGRYYTRKVTIKGGDTPIEIEFDLDPKYVASILIPDLINRKAPIMTFVTNAVLFLNIEVTNKFEFNPKDYLPSDISQVFFK